MFFERVRNRFWLHLAAIFGAALLVLSGFVFPQMSVEVVGGALFGIVCAVGMLMFFFGFDVLGSSARGFGAFLRVLLIIIGWIFVVPTVLLLFESIPYVHEPWMGVYEFAAISMWLYAGIFAFIQYLMGYENKFFASIIPFSSIAASFALNVAIGYAIKGLVKLLPEDKQWGSFSTFLVYISPFVIYFLFTKITHKKIEYHPTYNSEPTSSLYSFSSTGRASKEYDGYNNTGKKYGPTALQSDIRLAVKKACDRAYCCFGDVSHGSRSVYTQAVSVSLSNKKVYVSVTAKYEYRYDHNKSEEENAELEREDYDSCFDGFYERLYEDIEYAIEFAIRDSKYTFDDDGAEWRIDLNISDW